MPARRALPAVFVSENMMVRIAREIASLPADMRANHKVVLIKTDGYGATADQVVTYNHESSLPRQYPKADLERAMDCLASEIPRSCRDIMGASYDNGLFIDYLRTYWDEAIEPDTPVTVLVCKNFRGALIDYYVNNMGFLKSHTSLKE